MSLMTKGFAIFGIKPNHDGRLGLRLRVTGLMRWCAYPSTLILPTIG